MRLRSPQTLRRRLSRKEQQPGLQPGLVLLGQPKVRPREENTSMVRELWDGNEGHKENWIDPNGFSTLQGAKGSCEKHMQRGPI
jgi:hypothetical protein